MPDLRQNTIQTITHGSFVDSSDFETLQDNLDSAGTNELTQDKIRLRKNSTDPVDSGATSILSKTNGKYAVVLPVSAVDTRGYIDLDTKLSGSLIVEDRYNVLAQSVYDQKYGDKEFSTQENLDDFKTKFGVTKVKAIDGSDVDFVSMFIKALDDDNGDSFDATTDSLNRLRSIIGTGGIESKEADADNLVTGIIDSGNLTNTHVLDGTLYIVTPLGGGGGELEQTMDFICGANRLGVKIELYGWFGGGGNAGEFVSVSAYSWDDLEYKPISNNSNHMYKRDDVDGVFPYSWTFDSEFSKSDTGLVRLKFDSSTNSNARTFNIDFVAVDHLDVRDTTPSDIAHAVWNYVSKNNNIAVNTMGGYLSTVTEGQFLVASVTDAQNFQIAATFTANSYNGYPILVSDSISGQIYSAKIKTIDANGNIVLESPLPFTPTTDDAMQINYFTELSGDTFVAKESTLNTLASDLEITVDLGGGGDNLQGSLVDIYAKAGSGGGSGDCLKLTDVINGRALSILLQELSVRTTGRLNRIDNGDGTFTIQYYTYDNVLLWSKKVSSDERIDV